MANELLSTLMGEPWATVPAERAAVYFRCWQRVSVALQNALREWIPEIYFRDESHFDDREEAYQVVAYAASQTFRGQARTEFTYDVADRATVEAALRNTGRRLQAVLAAIEPRLRQSGRLALSRRYAPVWYIDILRAVKKRNQRLIALLACEAKVIDAVIDLGTARDAAAVERFERIANAALRNVAGVDCRELILRVIEESSRVLKEQHRATRGRDGFIDGRILNDHHARTAGSPDCGIGGEKDRDDRCSDRGSQVANTGIVSDVDRSRGEPTGQIV